jgi:hypothetical protein
VAGENGLRAEIKNLNAEGRRRAEDAEVLTRRRVAETIFGKIPLKDLPLETSLCAVARDPKAFDGKTIRVPGTFHVSFEVFTVSAEGCEINDDEVPLPESGSRSA